MFGDTDRADLARFAFNAAIASVGYAFLPLLAAALIPLRHWPECLGLFENTCTGVFLELATH